MAEIVFVEENPNSGAEHRVAPGTTIGREGCDVNLPDPEVSRRHATLRQVDAGVAVEDLGSTNGTFVNGQQVSGIVELKPGDSVRFGNTEWRLSAPVPEGTRLAETPSDATRMAETPAAAPTPAPPAAAPSGPPAAAAPAPVAPADGSRGDVPKPDFAPSAIRRALPAQPPGGELGVFQPAGEKFRRSAARRVEATLVSYAVVIATAIAVVVYFAQR